MFGIRGVGDTILNHDVGHAGVVLQKVLVYTFGAVVLVNIFETGRNAALDTTHEVICNEGLVRT